MNNINSVFSGKSQEMLFGLGTSQIASLGRKLSFNESLRLFKTAFENNVNIIDTSNAYGSGDAEYLIGKILEKLNADPFIITKAGFPVSLAPYWLSPFNQVAKKFKQKLGFKKRFDADYIINSLKGSLKRLKKKQVGAFLLHELTEDDIKRYDCWRTLEQVKRTGLAAIVGISSNEVSVVNEGINSGQVEIVETSVQIGNKSSRDISAICKSADIPVIANEVLGPINSGTYEFDRIISEIRIINGLEDIQKVQLLIGTTYCIYKMSCILFGTGKTDHLISNIAVKKYIKCIEENLITIEKIFSDNRKK